MLSFTDGFTNLSAFLHMGGYADYVWPAYALVFIVLVLGLVFSSRKLQKLFKKSYGKY